MISAELEFSSMRSIVLEPGIGTPEIDKYKLYQVLIKKETYMLDVLQGSMLV